MIQECLYGLPGGARDDRLVAPLVDLALVSDFAEVGAVQKHVIEMPSEKSPTTSLAPGPTDAELGMPSPFGHLSLNTPDTFEF